MIQLLTLILSCLSLHANEPLIDVKPISGGATNQNYCVQVDDRMLFLRLGESSAVEYSNASKAFSVGLTPKILYHNPTLNLIITSFVHDEKKGLDLKVVDQVRTLHQSDILFDRNFCPFEMIRENRHYCPPGIFAEVEKLHQKMGDLKKDHPCHLDLHMGNFLFEKDQVWMIDWEMAAMSDPLFDLATFASVEDLDEEQTNRLLTRYFARDVTHHEKEHFAAMRFLADVRWAIWSKNKAETSTLDWDYKKDAEKYMNNAFKYIQRREV